LTSTAIIINITNNIISNNIINSNSFALRLTRPNSPPLPSLVVVVVVINWQPLIHSPSPCGSLASIPPPPPSQTTQQLRLAAHLMIVGGGSGGGG